MNKLYSNLVMNINIPEMRFNFFSLLNYTYHILPFQRVKQNLYIPKTRLRSEDGKMENAI